MRTGFISYSCSVALLFSMVNCGGGGGGGGSQQPSQTQPSQTQPSQTQPPLTRPSQGQPPLGQPSQGQPPLGQPPQGQPLRSPGSDADDEPGPSVRPSSPSSPASPGQAGRRDPRDFKMKRDSFQFGNYGARESMVELEADNVERLCGPTACARRTGSGCDLTPAAKEFQKQANKGSRGGHCEGMSIASQLIYMGYLPLSRFDPGAKQTYDLKFGNRLLQSDIAFYAAMVATHPAGTSERKLTPVQVLEEVKRTPELDTVGLYDRNGDRGHAVVGIRVIDDDDEWSRIAIYDNNSPSKEEYIHVNRRANTWEYSDWEIGDARSKSMTVIPLAPRLAPQKCPFVGNIDAFESKESNWQIYIDGPGVLQAPDDAQKLFRRSQTKHERLAPILELKPHQDIELFVRGDDQVSKEKTRVVIFRNGQSMVLDGITLHKGQIDTIKLGKDGDSFGYATRDEEQVTFILGATYSGADYEIKITPKAAIGGFELQVKNVVDRSGKNHELIVELKNRNGTQAAYSVQMTRVDVQRDENFTHKKDIVIAGGAHRLQYGKWLKDKQPLAILKNGSEELVNDEE